MSTSTTVIGTLKEFSPLILSSSILVGAVSLWVLHKAISPIFNGLQQFFMNLIEQ